MFIWQQLFFAFIQKCLIFIVKLWPLKMIRIFALSVFLLSAIVKILFYFCFMTIMKQGERTICLSFQGTELHMTYHLIILCIFSFVILKLTCLHVLTKVHSYGAVILDYILYRVNNSLFEKNFVQKYVSGTHNLYHDEKQN